MRIPFLSGFSISPFDGLQEHAEKVKECGWAFQQAIECHAAEKCKMFDEYRQEVTRLENEADAVKRRIRGHLPMGTRLPVSRFQVFMYLKEQDKVLDSVEEALNWLSYRRTPRIGNNEIKESLFRLVDAVLEPIEELSRLVAEAKKYFDSYSEKQRNIVKDIIRNLRKREHEADMVEDELKYKVFSMETDPVAIFHLVKLAEIIGAVADHAENTGDVMRGMIARKEKTFFGK
ncbi:MAG: TIGR00153 family protein [Thermodesulfobacteriota bacterium]|nr:TIGR00153 family protein [Thermodesulfobacteriota bacterium]